MPLNVGDRLGPYEITGELGAGGMGEVWQARDTKLDRSIYGLEEAVNRLAVGGKRPARRS